MVYGNRQYSVGIIPAECCRSPGTTTGFEAWEHSTGVGRDEHIWSCPVTLTGIRTFWAAAAIKNQDIAGDDWDGAYLHAPLLDKPVFAILPDECVPLEVRANFRRPCRRLINAAYGGTRAGHDFDKFAREILEKKGWNSLALWDAEPAIYVRDNQTLGSTSGQGH